MRVRLRTRWSDEDNHAVLNNAVFLTLCEEARHALFAGRGLLEDGRFPFVLARAELDFRRPGRGGREVDVDVTTVRVGRSSFTQAYRIADAETGELWCEAVAVLVAVDAEGRSRPLPERLRAAVEAG